MRGDLKMIRPWTMLSIALMWRMVHSSGVHHFEAPTANAPVVTAASSQYFQRNFNRLVAAPQLVHVASAPQLVPVAPASPLQHAALTPHLVPVASAPQLVPAAPPQFSVTPAQPVFTVAPAPPVFLQAAQHLPIPLPPTQVVPFQSVQPVQSASSQPAQPTQSQPAQPADPNVSISIATANAAAPVATILLPPYPFGFPPPGFGFIPQGDSNNVDTKSQEPEQTTSTTTTQAEVKTTTREPEATTPLPAGSDNDFSQVLPSNQNINYKQHLSPPPQKQPQGFPSNQNVNFKQISRPSPQQPQVRPSNDNVNFRQYLYPAPPRPQVASNQNINFHQYPRASRPQAQQPTYPLPLELPEPLHYHHHDHRHRDNDLHSHVHLHSYGKPQKLKTLVEVVKAPLAYIGPQAAAQHLHHHEAVKVVKHVHTFVPTKAKLIIRPVSHHHTRSVPVKVIEYKAHTAGGSIARVQDVKEGNSIEVEFTTLRPFPRSNTKPPKL